MCNCSETRKAIMGTTAVFAIKYSHGGFVPLGGEIVETIPVSVIDTLRDERDMIYHSPDDSVFIYKAESEVGANGKRIFGTFSVKDPVFRISIATAQKYMPNLAKEIGW